MSVTFTFNFKAFFNKIWSDLIRKHSEACNFIIKETLAQVFSCVFCEISENTSFTEHLWATASKHFFMQAITNIVIKKFDLFLAQNAPF